MGKLRAVLFDIDDTLFSTSEFARTARRNSIRAMIRVGVRMSEKELMRELEEVIIEFSSNYQNHFDKLLQRIPRSKVRGTNPAIIVAAGVTAYHDTKFSHLRPYEDAVQLLRELQRTDLTLGVVTDGLMVKQAEKLLRLGVYPLFDPQAIFISDQIGISKPNPKLYRRACAAIGVAPSNVLYIGDNPLNDIDPPNSLGIHTVLLQRHGKYSHLQGKTYPDHSIRGFDELRTILKETFEVPFGRRRSVGGPAPKATSKRSTSAKSAAASKKKALGRSTTKAAKKATRKKATAKKATAKKAALKEVATKKAAKKARTSASRTGAARTAPARKARAKAKKKAKSD